jgi:hypothetical protein
MLIAFVNLSNITFSSGQYSEILAERRILKLMNLLNFQAWHSDAVLRWITIVNMQVFFWHCLGPQTEIFDLKKKTTK